MEDLEKAISEGKDAPLQAMVGGEEQEPLIPADLRVQPIEGDARFAAKINSDLKKWPLYLYWLLLVCSVVVLTNHVFPDGDHGTITKDQPITPALAMFTVLICAIYLMFRTMKRMA